MASFGRAGLTEIEDWHILPIQTESGEALMVTRNVVLTDAQDALVQALVKSGRYQNVSEAMRAGLRLLEQEEAGLTLIRQSLAEGIEQAHSGEFAAGSGEEAIERIFERALTDSTSTS